MARHLSRQIRNSNLASAHGETLFGARRTSKFDISQTLDRPGTRAARVSAATASVDRQLADADTVALQVQGEAAEGFYRLLYAGERLRLLEEALDAAQTTLPDRRPTIPAGDIAVLDVNLSKAVVARARADREAGEADRVLARGELARVLGISANLTVQVTSHPCSTGSRRAR